METLVIEARNKSDARFLRNFSKRIGARVFDDEELEDMAMCSIIEEGLKTPRVDRSVIMKTLEG